MSKNKIKTEDYYECSRCNINSETLGRMCPCPRGSCEATITGTITVKTIKEINRNLSEKQKKWNKDNYRE